jgi:hypothetical protein
MGTKNISGKKERGKKKKEIFCCCLKNEQKKNNNFIFKRKGAPRSATATLPLSPPALYTYKKNTTAAVAHI